MHGMSHHGRSGSRGRAQRGDVRVAILILLSEQPMHGYQLMQAMADRTQGAWRPSAGAIYPTLASLKDAGLVSVQAVDGRKLASLTEKGELYVTREPGRLRRPVRAAHRRERRRARPARTARRDPGHDPAAGPHRLRHCRSSRPARS